MAVTTAPFWSSLDRALFGGSSWRVKPYPGPLDLLLKIDANTVETAALRTISDEIVAARDRITTGARTHPEQLAFSLGPQEGKSTLAVYATALWLLLDNPDRRIIVISYEKEIAVRWGRAIRTAILTNDGTEGTLDLGLRVRKDTWAADRWELADHRGGIYSVGIGGAITGRPADVLLIDDPHKDKADARSLIGRKLFKDRWRTTINPRLGKDALVILGHTRWHEDDAIGWLTSEYGDLWNYVNIPARSTGINDPLDRPAGVWLQSARGRTVQQWETIRRIAGEYDFAALYQGTPMPTEGGLFKRAAMQFWQPVPASTPIGMPVNGARPEDGIDAWRVQLPGRLLPTDLRGAWRFLTVDLAGSTKTSADWTVAAAWAIAPAGELILLDLVRVQVNPENHWAQIRALQQRWDAKVYVEASILATDLVYSAGRAGVPLAPLHADRDKFTRAIPAATRFGQGSVYLPAQAHWLDEYIDELVNFPNGVHDDQVDVTAYASRVRSAVWTPDLPETVNARPRPDPAVQQLTRAVETDEWFDPMRAEF